MNAIAEQPVDPKMETQRQLEVLLSKNQLMPRLKSQFDTEIFLKFYQQAQIPEEFGIALLSQLALRKRVTIPTLVGLLRHTTNDAQQASDLLVKAINAELCDYDYERQEIMVNYELAPCVQADLERFQYPLPMVVEPETLTKNTDSGYVLDRSSVILAGQHHNEDVCLDHLNRVNRVKLCINHDTAQMVKNEWKNLDRPKEGETQVKFLKRQKAFQKYERTTLEMLGLLGKASDTIWLTHKYDKRGRTYCQGYHVTYQGTPWNKAILELADKELVQ
jgi:hypothetical protein